MSTPKVSNASAIVLFRGVWLSDCQTAAVLLPSVTSLTYHRSTDSLQVTILEGTATWCKQCKVIAPEVAKMVDEYPNVKFYLYDVEECEDVAQELGVRSMPTFSIFKDGDIQNGVTGAKPKEIRKAIEACL
jgi:thioredoxin 1